jgi:hypothetical protein
MKSVHRWFGFVARLYLLYEFSLLIFFSSHGIVSDRQIISLGSSTADAHQSFQLIIEVDQTMRCAEANFITRFGLEYDLQHLITTFFCYYTKTN